MISTLHLLLILTLHMSAILKPRSFHLFLPGTFCYLIIYWALIEFPKKMNKVLTELLKKNKF